MKKLVSILLAGISAITVSSALVGCGGESSLGEDENKLPVSTAEDNTLQAHEPEKEYYLSELIKDSAPVMQANIPYINKGEIDGETIYIHTIGVWDVAEEEFAEVKSILGEVKLERYDVNSPEFAPYFWVTCNPPYRLWLNYGEQKTVQIKVNNRYQQELGANLFVGYSNNGEYITLRGLISDEAQETLFATAKNRYESTKE